MKYALLSLLVAVSASGITVTSPITTAPVTTPVHFVASADGARAWVVTASDGRPLYKTANAALDGWVLLPQIHQSVTVTAMDDHGVSIGSAPLDIDVQGVAAPIPPQSSRVYPLERGGWRKVEKNLGGDYNEVALLPFRHPPPNAPGGATTGLHMRVASPSNEPSTNGLIEWTHPMKDDVAPLNALWTFSFAVPALPQNVEAYESDLVIVANVLGVSDIAGRQTFEFNTQYKCCVPNTSDWYWQSWRKNCEIPDKSKTCSNWVTVPHIKPGKPFTARGNHQWHTLTLFCQRVTRDRAGVYQSVPPAGQADANASLLYAVMIVDGHAMVWNVVENALESPDVPLVHVQHQIDTAVAGKKVDKWIVGQTLTKW